MRMDLEIRTISAEEFDAFARALEGSFSGTITPEELELERTIAEIDRYHAAFEDGAVVGCAAAVTYRMTVPGGAQVQTAGVTAVGVLPSHRRRGVNTSLMRTQLEDIRARGECLAALYASQGAIYGRFGYGLGSFATELNLETTGSAFVRGYRTAGRVRLLPRGDALPRMRPVLDAVVPTRPGMIELDDRWFEWRFAELERDKEHPWFYAVHEDDEGVADAYAVYKVKHEWPDSLPRLELTVRELMAATPQATADMWRYVFDIDLVHKVNAWSRPVDEELLWLLAEPRQLRLTVLDGLWVRLVDVPAALTARSYARDDSLVFEVRDDFCPWNDGRYRLRIQQGSVTCERSDDEVDIACSVNDLGAVYLGGSTFRQLHRAGQVTERTEGALARADTTFASDPSPWCSLHF